MRRRAMAGIVAAALTMAGAGGFVAPNRAGAASSHANAVSFVPPPESAIPDNAFGKMIRRGEAIFRSPSTQATQYVGNTLSCANCHLDGGRLANSAPLAQAYVEYPAYRAKTHSVNTFEERLQGCFRYSMNGKAPPLGDEVLVALATYSYFLAKGAPTGISLPGRGYPSLPKPALGRDYARGEAVFGAKCALCHGADGLGQKGPDGAGVFPALWGADSFNWGAGMGPDQECCRLYQSQHAARARRQPHRSGGVGRRDFHGQPRTAARPTVYDRRRDDTPDVPRRCRVDVRQDGQRRAARTELRPFGTADQDARATEGSGLVSCVATKRQI